MLVYIVFVHLHGVWLWL